MYIIEVENPVTNRTETLIFIHIPKTGGGTVTNLLEKSINLTRKQNIKVASHKFWGIEYTNDGSMDLAHIPWRYINKFHKLDMKTNLYIFACVRNPYDRLFSAYMWKNRWGPEKQSFEDLKGFFNSWARKDLRRIVEDQKKRIFQNQIVLNDVHYCPMYYYIPLNENQKRMIKYQDLDPKILDLDPKASTSYKVNAIIRQENMTKYLPLLYGSSLQPVKESSDTNIHVSFSKTPSGIYRYLKYYEPDVQKLTEELYHEDFVLFGYPKIEVISKT